MRSKIKSTYKNLTIMIKKIIFLTVGVTFLTSCSSTIDGEGAGDVKQVIATESVKSLEVDCNCQVTLIPGSENKIEVESHQNIIDNLNISNKGNIVIVSENKEVDTYNNYNVFVYVTKDLQDLELGSLTNLKISGTLNVDKFALNIKDQAKIVEAYFIANDMEIKAQNQIQIELQGTVNKLEVKAYDQANLDLSKFVAYDTEFVAEDNVKFVVNAKSALIGEANGRAIVEYLGDPRKDIKSVDQAQVIKK